MTIKNSWKVFTADGLFSHHPVLFTQREYGTPGSSGAVEERITCDGETRIVCDSETRVVCKDTS